MSPFPTFGSDFPQGGTFGGFGTGWPTGGGGGTYRKKPPAPEEAPPEPETPLRPAEEDTKAEAKPKVTLKNLAWAVDKAAFNEKVGVSLEADVPPALANIAKVEVKAIALLPNGKKEGVDTQPIFLKEGKASGQVTVFFPQYRENGNLLAECEFVFSAKHRDSDEAEGPRLKVKQPFATNVRWDKAEEWFGLPVKLLANTCLADGTEVAVKVASENGVAFEIKVKAVKGKLEIPWVPCLCGVAAEADGKYPEKVEYYAELAHGGETAVPAKNFFLKVVGKTEYEAFTKSLNRVKYDGDPDFEQRISNGTVDVRVRKSIMKAWPGMLMDMKRAKITGSVPGCPFEAHRWVRIRGNGRHPTEYFDGTKWQPMPNGFIPRQGEFFSVGFTKRGSGFIHGGEPSAVWPENFKDYDFDAPEYVQKRSDWKKDTDSRWSRKHLLRPSHCKSGTATGGCGYQVDLHLELKKVETWKARTIAVCKGVFRSNSGCFSLDDKDIPMAAHEVGHWVGMPDEYKYDGMDTSFQGDGAVNGIDATSIMGTYMDKVKKRHYVNFSPLVEKQVERNVGKKIAFIPSDI